MATDWRLDIDNLFKSQGFDKKAPELSNEDQLAIQEFIDNIGRPALENISDQLNSFQHVKSEVVSTKNGLNAHISNSELSVYKMAQPKLAYRLTFLKRHDGVYLGAQYSIPNIYGENTRYQDSGLARLLQGTTESEIAEDFFEVLKAKF